ncbi:DUF4231 domain-containing protein [Motilimonas sp. 1_MG-2023]|uniref:DUF4231 domain-containing protein n=1 Tax=Motilimonas sp. 1_MG-2023 TaxID=3062672 RepID=UPI0026E15F75|nr:DUF4231 domain-containing protein [Motilimonas sp. 1_MG-2023]MDO6528064.1 DUF4231 domain-containing protein [Motilimonas sp. 1_MG-2023]
MSNSNDLSTESAASYAVTQAKHFQSKADHNKAESIWSFRGVMICSLLAPLFVSLGEGVLLSKVIPSGLSAIAAFSTAWLQLRKPQTLWSVYRTTQRKIETALIHFKYKTGDYEGTSDLDADKLLILNVTSFASEAHHAWTKAVPESNSLKEFPHIEAKDK